MTLSGPHDDHGAPTRIALLGNTRQQAARLARLLPFPVELVDAATGRHEVDAVIALRFDRNDAERIRCRLLHAPGAGLDAIDLTALADDCWVCNVFEHEGPIAEFVLLSILEHAIGAGVMARDFTAARWSDAYRTRRPHREVAGMTLGLVGFGHIGRAIATRARACGMRIHAITSSGKTAAAEADWSGTPDRLHEMLTAADVVVIACPLTEQTRNLIGAAELAAMKPSSVLINVARAEIVVEADLFQALQTRAIAGATLDVWYAYPQSPSEQVAPSRFPFHELGQVRCTPHASAWTETLFERRYAIIADNIARLRAGETLRNVVRAPTARR